MHTLNAGLLFPQLVQWRHQSTGLVDNWWIPKEACGTGHLLMSGFGDRYWYSYSSNILTRLNPPETITDEEWQSEVCYKPKLKFANVLSLTTTL